MTCLSAGKMCAALMTRTERAKVTRHLIQCARCRGQAMQFAETILQGISLTHSLSALMFAHAQMCEDAKDPLFAEIVNGG